MDKPIFLPHRDKIHSSQPLAGSWNQKLPPQNIGKVWYMSQVSYGNPSNSKEFHLAHCAYEDQRPHESLYNTSGLMSWMWSMQVMNKESVNTTALHMHCLGKFLHEVLPHTVYALFYIN